MALFKSKKKEYTNFNVNVRFNYAVKKVSQSTGEARIKGWIKEAERLYKDKPSLKITPEWKWTVRGVPSNMSFKNSRELRKFMDDKFDNIVGKSKSEGCLQVLVVDSVEKKGNSLLGSSFFPKCVTPFGRKHGIIMDIDAFKAVFAHELGHMLSLKHTFESYVGLKKNCNKGYPKGDKGMGGTRKGKRVNVMDYKWDDRDSVFLNDCQRERSAKQRRTYMTKDGETNYRKLKGLR